MWQLTTWKRRAVVACQRPVPLAPVGWRADYGCAHFGVRGPDGGHGEGAGEQRDETPSGHRALLGNDAGGSRPFDDPWDGCPDCGHDQAELVHTIGAGRFWGYRGLRPVVAIRQVTPQVGIAAGRILRRWYRAKRLTKRVTVMRVDQTTGRIRYRTTTKRRRLFSGNRGFAIVNDGPGLTSQLAHHLAVTRAG